MSTGYLTTHVLDAASGKPGKQIRIELFKINPNNKQDSLTVVHTNDDGRCDQPLLTGDDFSQGIYELVFSIADYYQQQGVDLPKPNFLEDVVIRFGVSDNSQHYHVPLLISPYSYSTYRGS